MSARPVRAYSCAEGQPRTRWPESAQKAHPSVRISRKKAAKSGVVGWSSGRGQGWRVAVRGWAVVGGVVRGWVAGAWYATVAAFLKRSGVARSFARSGKRRLHCAYKIV